MVFHDVAFIEVKPHVQAGRKKHPATVAVELTDFLGFLLAGFNRERRSRLVGQCESREQDRGRKGSDCEGEQGQKRRNETRDVDPALDGLDRLLVGGLRL